MSQALELEDMIDLVWQHAVAESNAETEALIEDAFALLESKGEDGYLELCALLKIQPAPQYMPQSETMYDSAEARLRRERARKRMAEVIASRPPPEDGKVEAGEGAKYLGPAKRTKKK